MRTSEIKNSGYWHPYIAGSLFGLTLLATFFIAGRGLGASGAFSVATGTAVHAVLRALPNALPISHAISRRPPPCWTGTSS